MIRQSRHDRRAFTLVELIVVITILTLMMGLLLSGISAIWFKGKEAVVRSDISQLSNSIGAFKAEFGTSNPPTNLVLAWNYDGARAAAKPAGITDRMLFESESFLKKMFPRWNPSNNPNGLPVANNQMILLSGSQVLVFLLGGHSNGVAGLGFSDNPTAPFGAGNRKKPHFDFEPGRLLTNLDANNRTEHPNGAPAGASAFPLFLDTYGMPYAYFGSKSGNDYSTSNGGKISTYELGGTCQMRFRRNGIALTQSILPYQTTTTPLKFWNHEGFQLISAGNDGFHFVKGDTANKGFGPGGLWNPLQLPNAYRKGAPGFDDVSNFHPRLMGVP
jgi:prepilin-type N-terminal cleavage/methylation domain-containing protein